MFTVLVKKPDGREDIYECQELTKEPCALLLRGESLGSGDSKGLEILGPKGATMAHNWERPSGDVAGEEPTESSDPATIYVMNRYGKTIQTYRL